MRLPRLSITGMSKALGLKSFTSMQRVLRVLCPAVMQYQAAGHVRGR